MNTQAQLHSTPEYVDITLAGIFRTVAKNWYYLAGSLFVALTASVFIAVLTTPVYLSSTLISPSSGGAGAGGTLSRMLSAFGGMGSFLGGANTSARNARAVGMAALSSPYFTRAFIDDNNLLPILFAEKWDEENQEWLVDDPVEVPSLSDGYNLFSTNILTIDDESMNGLVNVEIRWKDAALAADWANMLVAGVNERLRLQAINDADLTIKYLNEELAKTTAVDLQRAIYFLIESEIQKRTVAKVDKEYSFKVVSPATASDLDDYVWPNRIFIASLGLAIGLFAGLLLVFTVPPVVRALRETRNQA